MEYLENPFTPSFGEVPAHLAGRQQIIRDLDRAFLSQRRRPELTSIFSGARGTGKTALMSSLATRAESHGWIAVKTTALPGMLEELEFGRNVPQPISSTRPPTSKSPASELHRSAASRSIVSTMPQPGVIA